jgi:hypothetical protein
MEATKYKFPAKIKVEGRVVHIGDFPTKVEASVARAAAGTLWNYLKPHFVPLVSWDEEATCK